MVDKALAIGRFAPSGLVLYQPYVPVRHDLSNTCVTYREGLCMIVLVSLIVLPKQLLGPTIFCMVHPYHHSISCDLYTCSATFSASHSSYMHAHDNAHCKIVNDSTVRSEQVKWRRA